MRVLLSGLDWLEVSIRFPDNLKGCKKFIEDTKRIYSKPMGSNVSYLGNKFFIKKIQSRYQRWLETIDGLSLYLDDRDENKIYNKPPITILLRKPRDRSQPCYLWEHPFLTMKDQVTRFREVYGSLEEQVTQVHLCCHITGWQFTRRDIALLSKGFRRKTEFTDENPETPQEEILKSVVLSPKKESKVKRITGIIYDINSKVEDDPDYYLPYRYYKDYEKGEPLFNIEFKLYRQAFRERGIETLSDLESSMNGLWAYLTNRLKHYSHKNGKCVSRYPVSDQWKVVQNAYGENVEPIKPIKYLGKPLPDKEIIKKFTTQIQRAMSRYVDLSDDPVENMMRLINYAGLDEFTKEAIESVIIAKSD